MKQTRYILLTIIAAFGLILTGCISDDFSTSQADILTFSTDTVSFDTVFTEVGTPTARLKVYNRAKKSINISSIRFKDADTKFQLNVDGVSGKSFSDVEIRGGDSIYIFIECYLPEAATSKPTLTEDKLQFLTNGVGQEVTVEAWGQNVTRLKALTLKQDMTLTAQQPYVVFDSLVVDKGATLRIGPGVQLLFHDKAHMRVKGKIEAIGKPHRMIDMRGDRLDDVLPDIGYDILAGQWQGITIDKESYGNRLEYVDMRATQQGLVVDSCANLGERKLLMVNSWLHNSQGTAFQSNYAWVDAYGCVFSEAAEAVVRLKGGKHEFVQCTLSNYYLYAAISEPLLSLYHLFAEDREDGNTQPLMQANFENCIVYGLGTDINEGDLEGSDVYMRYVLFKSEGSDDDHFLHCLWGEDPLFYTVRNEYYFNYRLQPDSPAIGAGDAAYVTDLCRLDMDGHNRLSGGAPALGAYVYIPPKEE